MPRTKQAPCVIKAFQSATSSVTGQQTGTKTLTVSTRQLMEMRELIRSYGDAPPRWFLLSSKITRPRRKLLLNYLYESGLDGEWCFYCTGLDEFDGQLHLLFHQLEVMK